MMEIDEDHALSDDSSCISDCSEDSNEWKYDDMSDTRKEKKDSYPCNEYR